MERWKVYLASFLFIGLTAEKLLMPDTYMEAREQLRGIISRDDDYREIVETIGRSLTAIKDREELTSVLKNREDKETVAVGSASETPPFSEFIEPFVLPEPLSRSSKEAVPEAVTVFLEKQAAFEGYSIPDNVRADRAEIPFEYSSPVMGYESSGFGYRMHPIQGKVKFHYGTDFAAAEGENICAFADGTVYAAGNGAGYGKYYIITHEGGFSTLYAHMSEFIVREGETVKQGQIIGKVGQTGNVTGPHLHFELLLDDVYLNPEYYL